VLLYLEHPILSRGGRRRNIGGSGGIRGFVIHVIGCDWSEVKLFYCLRIITSGPLVVKMDQLTPAQKSAIGKFSLDRIRLHLLKASFQEKTVLAFTKKELMQKYAELLVRGDPVEEGVVKTVDPELEKMRFEHEERMKKMEMELLLAKMAAEKEKLGSERAVEKEKLDANERLENERLELEQAKLGMERMKLQHEKDLKQVNINEKAKENGNVVKQLKRFGDALAEVIGPQPDNVTNLPSYFQCVEAQFTKLDVPATYQARLLHKYLAPKFRALCSRMDPKVRDDYVQMKNAILKEYGLTTKCFLDKFNTLKKNRREMYVMFSSKLKGLLTQYLTSRSVTTFDGLQSLLLSDRIKSALPEHCLKHVLSVESNLEKPCWLHTDKLVQVIDEYMSNVGHSPNVNRLPVGQNARSRFNAGTRFSVPNVEHNEAVCF